MINAKTYLRQIGIAEATFSMVLTKLKEEVKKYLDSNPLRKRGIQSKAMSIEDQFLLTLTYLRQYPTFITLGQMFGISESYANKIYHKITNYLIKFIHPKKSDELLYDDVSTVVIDAAEQPIERPVKKQKSFYSGKKKDIQ